MVTSIKELTNAVAPKLSQDEELFALGLADGAQEFFGEGMGETNSLIGRQQQRARSVDLSSTPQRTNGQRTVSPGDPMGR